MSRILLLMRQFSTLFLACSLLVSPSSGFGQESRQTALVGTSDKTVFQRVIVNQKKTDDALNVYQRIERVENRKTGSDSKPFEIKTTRVIPGGTGVAHIPVGPDGEPVDAAAYRAELQKFEKSLAWAVATGRAQQEAYERVAKKRRERDALIEAAGAAFVFTLLGKEPRDSRTLLKYHMEPDPTFKPTTRTSAVYTKVRGTVWVDEETGQLAKIEGQVTDDISVGLFLAKVYKGSHFMQECYEIAPGVWMPTYSQYDFDGRKFFVSFSIHERTFYSKYRYIGKPPDVLAAIRSELNKSSATAADR